MTVLGIDIGGSGIKGALVDTEQGKFASERVRISTPKKMTPKKVLGTVQQVVENFPDYTGPIGAGFPAVVQDGTPRTPFTAKQIPGWVGFPVAQTLSEMLKRPVTMLNDADAAGIAEMRFGNGRERKGVVIILTLGTGLGGAMFTDGYLVPNCEFSAFYLRGHKKYAEWYVADSARKRENLSWAKYAGRLDEYLHFIQRVFSPRLVILGGGISKKHHKFIPRLTVDYEVVPAALRNRAGIVGAAMAVVEGWGN